MPAPPKRTGRVPLAATRIYQLHIALQDVLPSVWRRVMAPDTLSMAKLSRVLLAAMGWNNSHLHEFDLDGKRIGIPDPDWPEERPLIDERKVSLGQCLTDTVTRFDYAYDFGDGWMHTVTIEAIHEPTALNSRPYCIAGANACPPDDVGGPHGYMNFLEAILDPRHPQHAEMWRWNGGPFDPAGFDINCTNAAIRKLKY